MPDDTNTFLSADTHRIWTEHASSKPPSSLLTLVGWRKGPRSSTRTESNDKVHTVPARWLLPSMHEFEAEHGPYNSAFIALAARHHKKWTRNPSRSNRYDRIPITPARPSPLLYIGCKTGKLNRPASSPSTFSPPQSSAGHHRNQP